MNLTGRGLVRFRLARVVTTISQPKLSIWSRNISTGKIVTEKSSSPTEKSWASQILSPKTNKLGFVDGNNNELEYTTRTNILKNLENSGGEFNTGNNFQHPNSGTQRLTYRKRLSDNSWTFEPMDDKLIWVDCEMTGLDPDRDVLLEIACIITDAHLNEIARQESLVVHVSDECLANMSQWCIKNHGESGLTEMCRNSSYTSAEIDEILYEFVKKHTKPAECPMAGNSIYMDRMFIRKQLPKFYSHIHYRDVDVSTIKEVARRWCPNTFAKAPKKKFAHRAIDDIMESITELKYYKEAFFVSC